MTSRAVVIALACVLGFVAGRSLAGGDPLESQVIFGTTCARCHEGECSGRLAFDRDSEAAAAHIQRFAGPQSPAAVGAYFAHLERMKKDCSYARLDVESPEGGIFPRAALDLLCVPAQQSCFVPLGELEPRGYRLSFGFSEERHVHAEIVTATFELVLEEYLEIGAQEATASFRASTRADHFLRLRADGPIRLERLVLEPQ